MGYLDQMWSQDMMMIKMNGKLYSGICSTEANKTNHKRFENDTLEIMDEACYQSADQGKNKFVRYNFYDGHHNFYNNPCNFYDNQCNSTGTDEDFLICWYPEDDILPNIDDDNNSSDHDIGSTVLHWLRNKDGVARTYLQHYHP